MTVETADPRMEAEGKFYRQSDSLEWTLVCPAKGHVIYVELMSSSLCEVDETWVPLLVLHSTMTELGGMVLVCKSLGHENDQVSRRMSSMFNRRVGRVHLCATDPCGEEGAGEIHVTYLQWFTLEGASSLLSSRVLQQARKWLSTDDANEHGEAEDPRGAGGSIPGEAGKGARPDKSRKKKVGEEADAEKANKLRRKLEEARNRFKGHEPGPPSLPGGAPPLDPGDGASAGERSVSSSSSVRVVKELKSGSKLKRLTGRRSRSRKRTSKEDSKGISSTSYAGRLAQQALAVTARTMEDQDKKDRKKSRGRSEKDRQGRKSVPQQQLQEAALAHAGLKLKKQRPGGSPSPPSSSSSSSSSRGRGRKRSRSRKKPKKQKKSKKSKKGKKSKKARRHGTTRGSSMSSSRSSRSSSTSVEILAPLKKKSQENPGSVLAMLLRHIEGQMDQGAKFDRADAPGSDPMLGGTRVATYLALYIKPQFSQSTRELRELHLLSSAIDTLRKGQLGRLGDILAGRFVALHQALLDQGWQGARFLEVEPMNDAVALSEGLMLQARKHAQLVSKSQGVDPYWGGSYRGKGKGGAKPSSWGTWNTDSQPKGKDKGKRAGKKGKAGKHTDANPQKAAEWKESQEKP